MPIKPWCQWAKYFSTEWKDACTICWLTHRSRFPSHHPSCTVCDLQSGNPRVLQFLDITFQVGSAHLAARNQGHWETHSKSIALSYTTWKVSQIMLQDILNTEIEGFLLQIALWTNQWFNKPKFHIFIHLTCHIRQFGPAILFDMEAFESFNTIIRAKSIHSNWQAPSRDITEAFAQANRIRHLLSGGVFLSNYIFPSTGKLPTAGMWKSVGPQPEQFVAMAGAVTKYLGLADNDLDNKPHAVGNITFSLLCYHIWDSINRRRHIHGW